MEVPAAILFFEPGARLTGPMELTLTRELNGGRLRLAVSARRREDVPALPWEAPFMPPEGVGEGPDPVFYMTPGPSGGAVSGRERLKRLLPSPVLRLGRRAAVALLEKKNFRPWDAWDGWGKPLTPGTGTEPSGGYAPLRELGVAGERTVPSRVLELPGFRLAEYLRLKERGLSIVSDNCWGGLMYHTLGLEMASPFINMFIRRDHFFRLTGDLPRYVAQPLIPLRPRRDTRGPDVYPVAGLGDVEVHLNHVHDPAALEGYAEAWARRAARFDPERVLVETAFATPAEWEKYREAFEAVPYPKIAFVSFPLKGENVVYLPQAGEFPDGLAECARALAQNRLPAPYDFLTTYLTGKLSPPRGED